MRDGEKKTNPMEPQQSSSDVSRETLPENVSRETSPNTNQPDGTAPSEKHKRSSVYLYLVVLFGAAFLMLLLAYFVQQRSSETTITDLRNSMNLSREEMLDEIQGLTEDNETLHEELNGLREQLTQLQKENAGLDAQLKWERDSAQDWKNRADVLTSMAILEQAVRDGDYELAAQYARTLCQGDLKLDLGLVNLERTLYDPQARLAELIPLLERQGALEKDELVIP